MDKNISLEEYPSLVTHPEMVNFRYELQLLRLLFDVTNCYEVTVVTNVPDVTVVTRGELWSKK